MTTAGLLLSAWNWEPSVIAGCIALAAGYLAEVRGRVSSRAFYFLGGVALLLLDLVSPIDVLGDSYLFSAHMLQHFVLALVVPMLLLLGTPRRLAVTALRRPLIGKLERVLASPPLAWSFGVGAMIAWHVPLLFNAALANENLHIFQHLSLLVTGTIFWWPILGPVEERRLPALAAVAYLFSACTACSILGALITFAPYSLYPAYLHPVDRLGILPLIRGGWGLDAKSDQQLGGMLMWVPGCFVYLSAILASLMHWYGAPSRVAEPGRAVERAMGNESI